MNHGSAQDVNGASEKWAHLGGGWKLIRSHHMGSSPAAAYSHAEPMPSANLGRLLHEGGYSQSGYQDRAAHGASS